MLESCDEEGNQHWPRQALWDRLLLAVLLSRDLSVRAPGDGGVGGMWLYPVLSEPQKELQCALHLLPKDSGGALVRLISEREMQWRGKSWREEMRKKSRGSSCYVGQERRLLSLSLHCEACFLQFAKEGDESAGRYFLLSFPHLHGCAVGFVQFSFVFILSSPQGRSCFCPSDQVFLNSSQETIRKEAISCKEASELD